jgi:hypothetical protein
MKRLLVLCAIASALLGCATIRPGKQVSDNQKKMIEAEKKVDITLEDLEANKKGRQIQTSVLAAGAQYSLSKVTNATIEVDTAQKLTERIVSIQGQPHLDELQKIKQTVDFLNSTLKEERVKGLQMLSERDALIIQLQKEKAELKDKYDQQMWDMAEKGKEVAKKADENLAVINSMNSMFGFGAVFYGLKRFFISCTTIIVVFSIMFLLLRILAATNPIAAGAFSIFNIMGTAAIGLIRGLTPKAFELTGFVEKQSRDTFKAPLTKIVDVVQELKEKMADRPDALFTLKDILQKFGKEMDQSDKDTIDDLLVEQKWKRRGR